jgi:LysM repeat protein
VTTTKAEPAVASSATYKVAKGDNPYKIAKKLGVTPQELLKANNIDDPTKLQIGQVLKVPGQAN